MKKIILLAVLFVGCKQYKPPVIIMKGDTELEFLFEHDGCKMYKFYDGGRSVYWSDCSGKTQSDYSTHNGKITTTHHEETITTN